MPAATPLFSAGPEELDRIWSALALEREIVRPPPPSAQGFPFHLRFGQGGNASAHQLFGWNHPEGDFTWTEGREAFLELPAAPTPGAYFLNARIAPLMVAGHPVQRVRVRLGAGEVGRWEVCHPGHHFALLPAEAMREPQMLCFELPDAISPRAAGLNDDERDLAIQFYELWLSPWEPVSL